MPQVALVLRVGLALVFSVAGAGRLTAGRLTAGKLTAGRLTAGKLSAGPSARCLVETFALSRRLTPAAYVLPWAELAVAAGLLFARTARWAGAASCLLLVVFSSLLLRNLRNLRNGRAGACNCFGPLGASTTLGRHPLLRNAVLASASLAVAATTTQPDLGRWEALGALGGALAWLVVITRERHPSAGDPSLLGTTVATLGGPQSTLGDLLGRSGVATLVFVDPGCGPCRSVLPALRSVLASSSPAFPDGPPAPAWALAVTRGPRSSTASSSQACQATGWSLTTAPSLARAGPMPPRRRSSWSQAGSRASSLAPVR